MDKFIIIIICVSLFTCKMNEKKNIGIIDNSISEKIFVEINGLKQGMFIKSDDINNPVLLFLHGGPGLPEYGLTEKYPTHLEKLFTVCWWEQRGAGISYSKDINPNILTIDNIVSDTIEITNYLRNRFNKEKIYIMGHSWGTLIGLYTVKKEPELFYAYIAIAQIVNQLESEKIAYNYMLEQYRNANNAKMVKKMENYDISSLDTIPKKYVEFRDKPMHELGIGSMHSMKSVVSGIFFPIMRNKEYTLSERINIWKAKSIYLNKTNLWEIMSKTVITEKITSVDIPVYFMHGIYDYTVNYSLAKEYYQILESPIKRFYTFENSAHSPIFEEPEKVINILSEDIIKNKL